MSKRPHLSTAAAGGSSAGVPSTSATIGSAPTATHVYTSSLAVPDPSVSLARIQAQLTELARQVMPFERRDVICRRIDDHDVARMMLEQDGMYAPIRRARAQSRLRVHFEKRNVDLRLYSRPAGKGPETMNVYNLVCVPLESQAAESLPPTQTIHKAAAADTLADIDAGANEWQQVIGAMGWEADHDLVRRGHRFVVRDEAACRVEVQLYQLYTLRESKATSTSQLERLVDTHILQATATLPLLVKLTPSLANNGESHTALDASKLSERAQAELTFVQDALQGLVQFGKEEE